MGAAVLGYQVVKSIGTSGQISLGKEHAGRKVLVENPEPGVWVIRTATIIPDNERWLHEPAVKKVLERLWLGLLKTRRKNPILRH